MSDFINTGLLIFILIILCCLFHPTSSTLLPATEKSAPFWEPSTREKRRISEETYTCPVEGFVDGGFDISTDLPFGWKKYYDKQYFKPTMPTDMKPGKGECVLWGAILGVTNSALKVGAFGNRTIVENAPPEGVWDHKVLWYIAPGLSGGFSAEGGIDLRPSDAGLFGGTRRMSWLLNGNGGGRAGNIKRLEESQVWRKVAFYGPRGVFCDRLACKPGTGLKWSLPSFCLGIKCTSDECCSPLPRCSPDVCDDEFLLKKVLPPWCQDLVCFPDECCEKKPQCTSKVCPLGYHLKPKGHLFRPPAGQDMNGCWRHECTREECCDDSPVCPDDVCSLGYALKTVNPNPFCESFDCEHSTCCSGAGVCVPEDCRPGMGLKNLRPEYCYRPVCTEFECCNWLAPSAKVTDISFTDVGLRDGILSGVITWVPPIPQIPNVTKYRVMMSSTESLDNTKPARFHGDAMWGTNQLVIFDVAVLPRVFIYTGNQAGFMTTPAQAEVVDIVASPDNVQFIDDDLDSRSLGGCISWGGTFVGRAHLNLGNGSETDFCIANTSWNLAAGNGSLISNGAPTVRWGNKSFDLDLENLAPTTEGVVCLLAVSPDIKVVEVKETFEKQQLGGSSDAIKKSIKTVGPGRYVILLTWGNVTGLLDPVFLAATFGVKSAALVRPGDSYVFVARIGAESPLREQLVWKEFAQPAIADIECPIEQIEMYFIDRTGRFLIGTAPTTTNSYCFPSTMPNTDETQLVVITVSSQFGSMGLSKQIEVRDEWVEVTGSLYEVDGNERKDSFGGLLQWKAITSPLAAILAFNVYASFSMQKGNSTVLLGSVEVTGSVNGHIFELDVPLGTRRAQHNVILIFAKSRVGEVKNPYALRMPAQPVSPHTGPAIVGTMMVLQFSKIMEALEKMAKKTDSKEIDNIELRGNFLEGGGSQLKVVGNGLQGKVAWRGPFSQLFPLCVSWHEPVLKMTFWPPGTKIWHKVPISCCKKRKRVLQNRWVSTCGGVWLNDEMLLQKVSNKVLRLYKHDGTVVTYSRKANIFWKIMNGSRLCSRTAIKVYAPLLAVLAITFLLLFSGQAMIAFILIGASAGLVLVAILSSRAACTSVLIKSIKQLPPKRIRKKVWKCAQVFIGCLPCAPAFIAQTTVGYLTGAVALTGSVFAARKAYGAAALIEGLGGFLITLYAIYSSVGSGDQGVDGTARQVANIVSSILVTLKALDNQIQTQERNHSEVLNLVDHIMEETLKSSKHTHTKVLDCFVLQAYSRGCLDIHLIRRFGICCKDFSKMLAESMFKNLKMFEKRSVMLPNSFEFSKAVAKVIDTAVADFRLASFGSMCAYERDKRAEKCIRAFEKALSYLVEKSVNGRHVKTMFAAATKFRENMARMADELKTCIDFIEIEHTQGSNGFVMVLGMLIEVLVQNLRYVRDEVTIGNFTACEFRILFIKIAQVKGQTQGIFTLLDKFHKTEVFPDETLGGMENHMKVTTNYLDQSLTKLAEMKSREGAPMKAIKSYLENACAQCEQMMQKHDELNRVAVVFECNGSQNAIQMLKSKLTNDLSGEKVQGQRMEDKAHIAQARKQLDVTASLLRVTLRTLNLVSAATFLLEEEMSKVERVLKEIKNIRRLGYPILQKTKALREKLHLINTEELALFQMEIIEYSLVSPSIAILNLQEAYASQTKLALEGVMCLIAELLEECESCPIDPPDLPLALRQVAPACIDEDVTEREIAEVWRVAANRVALDRVTVRFEDQGLLNFDELETELEDIDNTDEMPGKPLKQD